MKLEAKQRLIADELSPKQKAIDFNGNGKVDGDNLKKLRDGKKPVKAQINQLTKKELMILQAKQRLMSKTSQATSVEAAVPTMQRLCKNKASALKYFGAGKRVPVRINGSEEVDVYGVVALWEKGVKGHPSFLQWDKADYNAQILKIWKTTGTDLLEMSPLEDGSGILIYGYYRD